MFKNQEAPAAQEAADPNAAQQAEPAAPVFPPPNHSKWCQLLIWAACGSLVVCGVVTFILACTKFIELSHYFLSIYFAIFGFVAAAAEKRYAFATRCFGFLCTQFGLGVFFVFAGTLGLSFGVGASAQKLVPFICGICWVVVGGLCVTDTAIQAKHSTTTATVEGV